MSLQSLRQDIQKEANPTKARLLQRFFKTGKGEYAEGDVFLGIMVPVTRGLVKKYSELSLSELEELIHSKYHEERLLALLILVNRFFKHPDKREEIYNFYLSNTHYINNWDLVDLSAPNIIGNYLLNKNKSVLYKLIKSNNLWERRISILATFWFIKNGRFDESLAIAELLLKDKHDLIHKAVGWMLREIGKRDINILKKFLKKHYQIMPRTMLRYSIEKFPEKERKLYLKNRI
ncbi:MAG: DNA alkylation repair protein [Nanoarchaeota archaeon]